MSPTTAENAMDKISKDSVPVAAVSSSDEIVDSDAVTGKTKLRIWGTNFFWPMKPGNRNPHFGSFLVFIL